MSVFANDHEQVVFCHDRPTGLRAIVAIYSTALGPALGGTRFYPYASEDAALADVLNLSRGMAYKNALAGLDHGGGKAVIWGDPATDKTEALLRAYGRFVQSLGGRYVTACDVGTYVQDMDVVGPRVPSSSPAGRPTDGGAGDSSVLTAWGVFQGMRACAERCWGIADAARAPGRRRRGRQGRPAPGRPPARGRRLGRGHRRRRRPRWRRSRAAHPQVDVVADADALVRADIDVYAPCALGGALSDEVVAVLRARVVCGAANNQLAHPGVEKLLEDRGILYAPDYVVNAGGVIQVADEYRGFGRAGQGRRRPGSSTPPGAILAAAAEEGVPPARRGRPAGRAADRRGRPAPRISCGR